TGIAAASSSVSSSSPSRRSDSPCAVAWRRPRASSQASASARTSGVIRSSRAVACAPTAPASVHDPRDERATIATRPAARAIVNAPRRRLRLRDGALADMAASDLELGLAGGKLYAASSEGVSFVVCIFETDRPRLVGVIEADHLGRLRTGAASGVAARHLAR